MKQIRILLVTLCSVVAMIHVDSSAALLAAPLAQESAPATAQQSLADAQFAAGLELYEAESWSQALSTFQSAYRLFQAAGNEENSAIALLYVGLSRAALDDVAGAREALLESSAQLTAAENRTYGADALIALGDLA
ncbi:MAG: hypothetical protein KDE53_17090, partial [Caldilineaceae bacterium]|nr:hypothetical protein [Caldilineaceae bacterium]